MADKLSKDDIVKKPEPKRCINGELDDGHQHGEDDECLPLDEDDA